MCVCIYRLVQICPCITALSLFLQLRLVFGFFSLTYVPSTELTRTRVHDCAGEKSVFEVFVTYGFSHFWRCVQRSFERNESTKHAHRDTITENCARFIWALNSQANNSQRSRHQRCTCTFTINRLTLFMRNLIFPSCCIKVIVHGWSCFYATDNSPVGCFQTQFQVV